MHIKRTMVARVLAMCTNQIIAIYGLHLPMLSDFDNRPGAPLHSVVVNTVIPAQKLIRRAKSHQRIDWLSFAHALSLSIMR